MFTHIVFFKLKEATEENIIKIRDILNSMEGKIEELKYLEVGVDELHTERSFDICLITKFNSKEDMDIYQLHPYHQNEILAKIKPFMDSSKTVDYTN